MNLERVTSDTSIESSMFMGGNESLREYKGIWPHFTRKSSNHLENTYMYIHRSQLCLWCGLEMRIFKNKILEKIFFFF